MFRAILDVAIGLFIVVGTIAVPLAVHAYTNDSIYDPSVYHSSAWKVVFGDN